MKNCKLFKILICIASFGFTLSICFAQEDCNQKKLPSGLMIQGKPITDDSLKHFLFGGELYETVRKSYFGWEYIGELTNGCYVVWSHFDTSFYRSTGFHILKPNGNTLELTGTIDGCDNIEVLDPKIEGNQIIFRRITTSLGLMEETMLFFPEIKPIYEKSSKKGICFGFVGVFKYRTLVTEEGKVQEPTFISFYPAEGWPPYSGKEYQKNDLKKLALDILADIEAEEKK